MQTWETTFNQLMDALMPQLTAGETLAVSLVAEESEFTRFNHAKVRQTGSIENGSMSITLMGNGRSTTESITFTGEKAADWPLLQTALQTLREELPQLPEDTYLVLPEGDDHSREVYDGELLAMDAIAPTLLPQLAGLDAVGLYAGGALCAGLCRLCRSAPLVRDGDFHPRLFPLHRIGAGSERHLRRTPLGQRRLRRQPRRRPNPAGADVPNAQTAGTRPVSHLLCARRCR